MFPAEETEADAFACFSSLMGELRDVFVEDLDDSSTGIKGRMAAMIVLLERHDSALRRHLQDMHLDPTFYSLRWITTLLAREFTLPDTCRLWDALFAEKGGEGARDAWLSYFCVAMVIDVREELLVAEFGEALNLLQAYPPMRSIDDLLERATSLKAEDEREGLSAANRAQGEEIQRQVLERKVRRINEIRREQGLEEIALPGKEGGGAGGGEEGAVAR